MSRSIGPGTPAVTLIITLALLTFADASTCVAADFPYYPEYAEEFAKVEEVTPLLMKKHLLSHCFWGLPYDVVCEPLLVRDVKGMPIGFVCLTYGGDDFGKVRRWNALARKLNAGEGMRADKMADEITSAVSAGFASYAMLGGYDFAILAPGDGSGGFTTALSGFRNAWTQARVELGSDKLYFKRVVGLSRNQIQAYEFEAPLGAAIFVGVGEYNEPYVITADELRVSGEEGAKAAADLIARLQEEGTLRERRRIWRDVDEAVPDEYACQELPRMITPPEYVVTPELAREAALWLQCEYYPEEGRADPQVSEAKVFYDYRGGRGYYAVYLYFGPGDMPTWEILERDAGGYFDKATPFRSFIIPADKRESFDFAGRESIPLTLYPYDTARANLRRFQPAHAWEYERTFVARDDVYFLFRAGDEEVITDREGRTVAPEILPRIKMYVDALDVWREIGEEK